MELKRPGKVRLVHHVGEVSEQGVDFVVIPGVWNENSPGRMKGSCTWVKPLAASTTSDTRVFLFHYQLDVDGSSLWDQLLSQSYALLSGLDEGRAFSGQHLRPLLFICHSLGGLILKKALTLGVRTRQAYQDATAAILFLGSPHLASSEAEGWGVVRMLMKANRKDISKHNMTDFEKDAIISTCRQFEDLQLGIPILSVYETRETKIKGNIFQRSESNISEMLISKAMVQINTRMETTLPVDKTHVDLVDVDEVDTHYPQLVQFFSMIVRHAPGNAQYTFRPVPQDELERLTLRTKSSIESLSVASSALEMRVYTPQTGDELSKAESGAQSYESLANDLQSGLAPSSGPDSGSARGADFASAPETASVKLPFSHTGSIVRNPGFYGRTDTLDEIDYAFGVQTRPGTQLQAPDQEISEGSELIPKTFILCGMAGIGKTETASEYLYSRRDHFDAVIWIYADTTRKLAAQFVTLAKELSRDAVSDATDEIAARELVKEWLANPVGQRTICGKTTHVDTARWLLIFDNADVPDVIYDWLPSQGPGCILVTSKYPYVKEKAYRLDRGIDLETFSPEVGGDMLRKLSGREDAKDAVSASIRISEAMGGLPLAIFQMSAIIRENHLTFQDFKDWYREDAKELYHLRASGMRTNYQHTIGTAWAIEQLSPSALVLLNVLSVLDPDRIPEELLTEGAKEVELPNYPTKMHVYFKARAELIHASMVTRNLAANELRVHRLVQDVVRFKMGNDNLQTVFAAVATLMSAVWPWVSGTDPTRNQASRIPIAERFTPHICKLVELFGEELRGDEWDGTATSGYLFSSYAWYISERGVASQTEVFASLARNILQKAIKREPTEHERVTHWLGEAHHSLSLAACLTGSSDGVEDAEIWVGILHDRIEKYNQKSDKLALATAYNQEGICLASKGKFEEAMDNFRKSLATFQSVEDAPQFSGTFPAISLANLCALQGRPDEGEAVIRPTLEEHERVLGIEDETTTESGHIWRAMGHIRNAQKRYEEALVYHERALKNIKATVGDTHYFSGDFYYSLAEDLIRRGDNTRATEMLDSAIHAFTAVPGREAQAARALWKKGCLLRDTGDESAGKGLFRKAIQLRRELVPADKRTAMELTDEDWTKLIIYWSR